MRTTVGAILTFGAISAPVGVASAGSRRDVELNTIHICGSKAKQAYVCPTCDPAVPVPAETLLKGYQVAKNQYIAIDVDEYKAITEARSRVLKIDKFVANEDVFPFMVDKHYFLTPSEHVAFARPYELILSALMANDSAGFGHCRLWGKEYPFVIQASGAGLLTLATLFCADEMPPPGDELAKLPGNITTDELALMTDFMALRAGDLEASDLRSSTSEQKAAYIDKVISGVEVTRPEPVEEQEPQLVDLQGKLREMVEAASRQ